MLWGCTADGVPVCSYSYSHETGILRYSELFGSDVRCKLPGNLNSSPSPSYKPPPLSSSQPLTVESPKDVRPLHLIYSAPMADFLIPVGDIKKNETLFPLSGRFEVEFHSKYKGPSRDGMIKEVNKMIAEGKIVRGSGNPDSLSDVVSTALFDTRKKTVNFSGKQSYMDANNAIIGTREIQETFDLSSPKYSTLNKVYSGIESLLKPGEKIDPTEKSSPPRPTLDEIMKRLKNPSIPMR